MRLGDEAVSWARDEAGRLKEFIGSKNSGTANGFVEKMDDGDFNEFAGKFLA